MLLECNKEDQTIEGLKKLIYVATPSKNSETENRAVTEVLVFEKGGAMDYTFYYDKFLHLDEGYRSVELARKAIEVFSVNPEFELKSLYSRV